MNKTLIASVAIVIVIAAGVGIYVSQNVDGLVKNMIETIGTETTGTKVQVAAVKLSLTDGSGVVSGVTVANPEGFSVNNLFSLGSVMVDIDPASLTEDVYVIESITIDGAEVLAEQVGGGTNIQALLNGMSSSNETSASESKSQTSDTQLAVREIKFSNGNVQLKSDVFGERSLTLPDFTIRDLGTVEDGLTPEELGTEIASQLTGQVKDAVVDELSDLAREAAKAKIKEKIGEKASEGLEKLKGLFGNDG